MIAKLTKKNLGYALMPLERICALLDPRRKECSTEHLSNGTSQLKSDAVSDVSLIAKTFVEDTAVAKRGGDNGRSSSSSGGGSSNPEEPPPKKQNAMSDLEERRLARPAKSKNNVTGKVSSTGTVKRHAVIDRELRMYLAEDPHSEEDGFSLLGFWKRRSKPSPCTESGEVQPGLPHLALIARLHHGVESTSCQSEKTFSALGFLIGNLRSSIMPSKVERMMFLRLNRLYIPEAKTFCNVLETNKLAAAR